MFDVVSLTANWSPEALRQGQVACRESDGKIWRYGTAGNSSTFVFEGLSVTASATFGGDVLRSGAAGTERLYAFGTSGSYRWAWGVSGSAESGNAAGSNFFINSYNDNGSFRSTVVTINRNTGAIAFLARPTWSAGYTPWDSNNFDPNTKANLSGAMFTGDVARSGAAGTDRFYALQTSNSFRWVWGVSASAESGSATGSNFYINSYNDDGTYRMQPLFISRFTGLMTVGNGLVVNGNGISSNGDITRNGAAGTQRNYTIATGGSLRWAWGATNNAEAGSSAGSDWFLNAHNDDGTYRATPLRVNRSDGILNVNNGISVLGSFSIGGSTITMGGTTLIALGGEYRSFYSIDGVQVLTTGATNDPQTYLSGSNIVLRSRNYATTFATFGETISFNKPAKLASYTVATAPAGSNGQQIYMSNGRKLMEMAGAGTGVVAYYSNGAWRRLSDDVTVAA